MTTNPSNITARGRQRRAILGIVGLLAGTALTVWLYPRDVTWLLGLTTLPLFLLGTLGVVQALTKT